MLKHNKKEEMLSNQFCTDLIWDQLAERATFFILADGSDLWAFALSKLGPEKLCIFPSGPAVKFQDNPAFGIGMLTTGGANKKAVQTRTLVLLFFLVRKKYFTGIKKGLN